MLKMDEPKLSSTHSHLHHTTAAAPCILVHPSMPLPNSVCLHDTFFTVSPSGGRSTQLI